MNVRKPVDYSAMLAALDMLMVAGFPQMELYCKIGQLVISRVEKGAAVDVVILEAGLTLQKKVWYIQAARQFGWSKLELQQKIASGAHLEIVLDFQDEVCYTKENNTKVEQKRNDKVTFYLPR